MRERNEGEGLFVCLFFFHFFRQHNEREKKKITHVRLVDLSRHHLADAGPADPGTARVRQLEPCLESGVEDVLGLFAGDRDLLAAGADKRDGGELVAVDDRVLVLPRRDDVAAELVGCLGSRHRR